MNGCLSSLRVPRTFPDLLRIFLNFHIFDRSSFTYLSKIVLVELFQLLIELDKIKKILIEKSCSGKGHQNLDKD